MPMPRVRPVRVGDAVFGGPRLALIAGPCVLESERHARRMATAIGRIAGDLGIPWVFKASYDKANRTSLGAFRGVGARKGLAVLGAIGKDLGVPVLSDVHSEAEVGPAAEVVDVLQIPAFLCRQTDLLLAAGRSGRVVNVKKGQFLAPWDAKNLLAKVASTGNRRILLTERGASFGYNNLVSDMRAIPILRGLGAPAVFDATHSAQLPGGQGGCSGGDRAMAEVLARAAVAAGADALFLEVHDAPERAPCDGPNMIRLRDLRRLLETCLAIRAAVAG